MESESFLSLYYPEALKTPQIVNGLTLASRMGLSVLYLSIADSQEVRGQIYFEPQSLEILAANGNSRPGNLRYRYSYFSNGRQRDVLRKNLSSTESRRCDAAFEIQSLVSWRFWRRRSCQSVRLLEPNDCKADSQKPRVSGAYRPRQDEKGKSEIKEKALASKRRLGCDRRYSHPFDDGGNL